MSYPGSAMSRRALLFLLPLSLVAPACAHAADGQERALARAEPTATTEPLILRSPTTVPPPTATTVPPPPAPPPPPDLHALRPPAPAGDPGGLAGQIVAAETTIRNPAAAPVDVANAGLLQQVAYRQLGSHPEWDAAVLAAVPPELHAAVTRHASARREFRSMHGGTLSSTVPAWRIVAPESADALLATYKEAEAAFGVSWKYLAAINLVETGIGRIRGTSSAGAQGPMQFMPPTWAAYGGGGDINNTRDAIFGAARYLAANNGAADIDNALYRYNHSHKYVLGVRLYADLMAEHPRAFYGFYHWGIWYLTDHGDVWLPVGYEAPAPIPVADYLASG